MLYSNMYDCCAHLVYRFHKLVYVWVVVEGCHSLLVAVCVLEVVMLVYQVH